MAKNNSKITEGLRTLTNRPFEIVSGTVVAGSVDETAYTMSVLTTGDDEPIEGVMLNAVTNNSDGVILIPEDGSNVVIGSVDGPGEWMLVRASNLRSLKVKIGNVTCAMDSTQMNLQNGSVQLNISDSLFKINTASESLFELLKDCFTYLTELTVPTPSGPSGIPVNVTDFSDLLTRLNNLLEA